MSISVHDVVNYEQCSNSGSVDRTPLAQFLCPNRDMFLTFADKYTDFSTLTSISGGVDSIDFMRS